METTQSNSTKTQISEFKLRQLAGLCQFCGIAVKHEGSPYCEQCLRGRQIPAMERKWVAWGIAA